MTARVHFHPHAGKVQSTAGAPVLLHGKTHEMAQPLCRWGILGTATIARKNWQALRYAGNAALVAAASRDPPRAQRFTDAGHANAPLAPAPVADGRYQEPLGPQPCDPVFIPLPTA